MGPWTMWKLWFLLALLIWLQVLPFSTPLGDVSSGSDVQLSNTGTGSSFPTLTFGQ